MAFLFTLLYVSVLILSPAAFGPDIAQIHLQDILGGLTILASLVRLGGSEIISFPQTYLTVALFFAIGISAVASGWLGGGFYAMQDVFPTLVIFFFIAINCRTLLQLRILAYVLFGISVFVVTKGLVAQSNLDYMNDYLMVEHQYGINMILRIRGLGVINDPNDLAQFLLMLLPLMFLTWKPKAFVRNFFLSLVPSAFLLYGIFETHSRGAQIALAVLLLFGFKDKLGIIGSAVLAGAVTAAFIALGASGGRGMATDDGDRVGFWSTGLSALKLHPLFGVGFKNFADLNHGMTAHNSFVICMAELGVIGYLVWSGLLVSAWTQLSTIARSGAKKVTASTKSSFRSMHEANPKESAEVQDPRAQLAATRGAALMDTRSPLVSTPSYAGHPSTPAPSPWIVPRSAMGPEMSMRTEEEEADVRRAAKILRVSMVGMLTAGFFLSRALAADLFLLLGIIVAVTRLSKNRQPTDLGQLTKRSVAFVFLSIIFIYVTVRALGGR